MEEGEKYSSRTWKHGAGRTVNHVETFLRRSQKRQWKENHTVAELWKPVRSGLDRFLSGSPQRKPLSIIHDKILKPANEALDASLKDLAWQGLISFTKHKSPISREDLEVLNAPNQLALNNPKSLVNSAWFLPHSLLWKEMSWKQCAMKPGDLQLKTTTSALTYFVLSERASENQSTFSVNPSSALAVTIEMIWYFRETETHFFSNSVFEQYVGKDEPKAPSFRVFDVRACLHGGRVPRLTELPWED